MTRPTGEFCQCKQEGLAVASIARDDPSPLPGMHRDHNMPLRLDSQCAPACGRYYGLWPQCTVNLDQNLKSKLVIMRQWTSDRETDSTGLLLFSARCNVYISRLCYDFSVCLSVRLSVTEVHWRIIANLCSNSDPNLLRIVVAERGNLNISRYASHC